MFYAHHRESDETFQQLTQHLQESADIAGYYGAKMKLFKTCYLAGLIHDAGKFSDAFQNYLRDAIEDPKNAKKGSVDHSTAGARMLCSCIDSADAFQRLLCELVANAVISHHSHSGIQDFVTGEGDAKSPYIYRTNEKELPEQEQVEERFFCEALDESAFKKLVMEAAAELKSFWQNYQPKPNESFFIGKYIYSCLLEGDRTNTRLFEEKKEFEPSDFSGVIETFAANLEEKFQSFSQGPATKINHLRQQMADECLKAAGKELGIYKLSIPTGGGKTLSSLRFALNHALKHKQQRVIYVIPFLTITEQNAEVARDTLKDDGTFILEHHSNVVQIDQNETQSEESEKREAVLRDNWDAPVIFTTMVRFLEVAFAGGTRNPRRFHQLSNTVLIFDEIQSIPTKCVYLFNELIKFLVKYCHTTVLLCTATQPALENVSIKLPKGEELISNLPEIEEAFRRTRSVDLTKKSGWSLDDIFEKVKEIMQTQDSLLIILNTKNAVREVFQKLEERSDEVLIFHLSTSMCPAHRKEVLDELKEQLKARQRPIICVTTPLIEAGVDISFECVIRSTAGLDSIAQASGRCNRNGESPEVQPVYLINPVKSLENAERLKEIDQGKQITEMFLKNLKFAEDNQELLDNELIHRYFVGFYQHFEPVMKYPLNDNVSLFDLLGKNEKRVQFYHDTLGKHLETIFTSSPSTVAQNFRVIETAGKDVLVPHKKGEELIASLNGTIEDYDELNYLVRQAQSYCVTLYQYQIDKLAEVGAIKQLPNGDVLAVHPNAYDKKYGINIEGDSHQEASIF